MKLTSQLTFASTSSCAVALTIMTATFLVPCHFAPYALASDNVATDPNSAIASTWWPALRNTWTPIGVKNHPFRFNVLYNGTVIADPHPLRDIGGHPIKTYLAPFADFGVQMTFSPSIDGQLPPVRTQPYQLSALPDGGVGMQGWDPRPTPLLWTRWPFTHHTGNTGVVLREEVFAHTPNGKPVETGASLSMHGFAFRLNMWTRSSPPPPPQCSFISVIPA